MIAHHPGRPQNLSGESESLQADVMRFMAIIAFCLIAILALVRNVEPVEATTKAPRELSAKASEEASPLTEPVVVPPVPAMLEPITRPEEPLPVKPQPEPMREASASRREARAAPVTPEPTPSAEPAPAATPTPAPDLSSAEPTTEPDPIPAPSKPDNPDEPGVILRFASDGDFLRLIARGDIRVYAFRDTDILTLNESYRFLDSPSPGQVYELLRPSIPSLVLEALEQARSDAANFSWGIALPTRISAQIERHLGEVRSGQLVIDRYGDVHHVAAS